ncbi:alpha/beta hydrolase-fold protein [Neisseriaceae bacterium ESL0693]|nr:alpha/beta hydrolase-fold protein [Neisseriaceae bacterium ESL0693]
MKKIFIIFIALILPTLTMAAPDLTRTADFSILTTPHTGYRFQTLSFDSDDGQRHYRVYVGIPAKAAPATGFPVFYSLDGNALLEQLTPARLQWLYQQTDTPVIVLLGYANDLRLDTRLRSFDYTPPNPHTQHSSSDQRPLGGADAFLTLIQDQIQPAIGKLTDINPSQQTLYGHSYGGLFVLYTLFHQPQLFQHYVAADPSLWEQQGIILEEARQWQQQPPLLAPTTLWLMKSGRESPPPAQPLSEERQKYLLARQQSIRKLGSQATAQLNYDLSRHIPGLTTRYNVYAHDTHGSLLAEGFWDALSQPFTPQN